MKIEFELHGVIEATDRIQATWLLMETLKKSKYLDKVFSVLCKELEK
jgi:hypothetical protein